MKNRISALIILIFVAGFSFAQNIDQQFFTQADAFFKNEVKNGLISYAGLKNNNSLKSLINTVENADLTGASDATKKAFYINAYNLHVINAAASAYPINSVQSIPGFFDRKKVEVGGKRLTLNNLEKQYLLKPYGDGRLHFVLVCGALGCPPITNFAYVPEKLDEQLDQQTRIALNNDGFLKVNGNNVELSQIFKWYPGDFGGSKNAIIAFINKFRNNKISSSAKISYYQYDWTLNDLASASSGAGQPIGAQTNQSRYIVSSTIPKGSIEVKIFNNLYTQRTGNDGNLTDRSTFFTTSVSALYGLTDRFNIGFNSRYRRVRNDALPSSALSVLGGSGDAFSTRQGLTAFGPQIRYAPVKEWSNFSIQSSFFFAIGEDLTGNETQPFIDWNGATWWTQIFNDFTIGSKFSLFTEVDFLIEDIGSSSDGRLNRFSTPATLILSYTPTTKATFYALGGYSPFWQSEFDYFAQAGVGAKYQFTPNLELELLYTGFTNQFLQDTDGRAATYNLGFRFNL